MHQPPFSLPIKNGDLAATPNLPSRDLVGKRAPYKACSALLTKDMLYRIVFSTINNVLADVSLISQLQGDRPQLKTLEFRDLSALQQLPPFHAIYFSSKKPIPEDAKSEGGTRNVVVCLIFPEKLYPKTPKLNQEKENAFHPISSVIETYKLVLCHNLIKQFSHFLCEFPRRETYSSSFRHISPPHLA